MTEFNDLKILLDKSYYTLFSTNDWSECLQKVLTDTVLSLLLMAIKFNFHQCTKALCGSLKQRLEEGKPSVSATRDALNVINRLYHLEEDDDRSTT